MIKLKRFKELLNRYLLFVLKAKIYIKMLTIILEVMYMKETILTH